MTGKKIIEQIINQNALDAVIFIDLGDGQRLLPYELVVSRIMDGKPSGMELLCNLGMEDKS